MVQATQLPRPTANPSATHVVVETEHRTQLPTRRRRRVPIRYTGLNQPVERFPAAAENYPTNFFTSNSTPSRMMKKHALDSLLAKALSATTRCLRAALR